jgi:hypothetical protein
MPTGELRPRIKCGAVKLTSDRAMQTDTYLLLLCWNRKPRLRAALVAASCSVVWGFGFGFRRTGHRDLGAGRALAPVHLAAPSLCPEKSGPGLCFLASSPEISRGGHEALPSPSWLPRGGPGPHPAQPSSSSSLATGPRGRTAANIAASRLWPL